MRAKTDGIYGVTAPLPIIITGGGCWEWQGTVNDGGYGVFVLGGKRYRAHRWVYELEVGPIPAGLSIDHLCRTRHCVNPDHLEPVTVRTNNLRGTGNAALRAAQTHCVQGHEFTPENTYVWPRRPTTRTCRRCRRDHARAARSQAVKP